MTITYFNPIPQTLEDLKKAYRALILDNHPDKVKEHLKEKAHAITKRINAEYEHLFNKLKNTHRTFDGDIYTSTKENTESSQDFIDLIEQLIHIPNIVIEIIGTFVWVSGETKPIKDLLKKLKFAWAPKKKAWYLKPPNYVRKSRKNYSLDDIRNMYGSEEVETRTRTAI